MAKLKTDYGFYKFKQKNIVLGIKKIDKEVSKRNLLEVKDVLDKNGLYFGLMFGTLLGAIREHDFITHDEDIDLFILSEDEEKFKSILFKLREVGFELIRYERSGLYSIFRNGEYIDFYTMKPFKKGVRYWGGDYLLEKYLIDTILIDFQGVKFVVPTKCEEFLELCYGSNWRTPIEYTNGKLSKFKIVFSKIKSITKRLLPNYMYQKLLLNHHKADFERFLKRCKEMNIEP